MEKEYKEVRFDIYCETCEYKEKEEKDCPCHECLDSPLNLYSEKPIKYKKKEK